MERRRDGLMASSTAAEQQSSQTSAEREEEKAVGSVVSAMGKVMITGVEWVDDFKYRGPQRICPRSLST